jgi:hypothetical protein
MTLADLSFYLFTIFNGLRVVSYLPRIVRVAQNKHGATAISSATWLLWTAANATTGFYAHINLNDPALAAINWLNAACCALVIAFTACKRHRARPRVEVSATRPESTAMMVDNIC